MKLDCHILSVEDAGDVLRIRLQGRGSKDADWRPLSPQIVEVANTTAAARSFHVGRRVSVTIEAK